MKISTAIWPETAFIFITRTNSIKLLILTLLRTLKIMIIKISHQLLMSWTKVKEKTFNKFWELCFLLLTKKTLIKRLLSLKISWEKKSFTKIKSPDLKNKYQISLKKINNWNKITKNVLKKFITIEKVYPEMLLPGIKNNNQIALIRHFLEFLLINLHKKLP